MLQYCVSFEDILLHIRAVDREEAIQKAKQELIQKIRDLSPGVWPDYEYEADKEDLDTSTYEF